MKVHRFTDPIYNRKIVLIIATCKEYTSFVLKEYQKKEEEEKEDAGGVDSFVNKKGGREFVMWADSNKLGDKHFNATIEHELFHLTHNVLRYVGLEFSEESEEAFAYYHEYICLQIKGKLYGRKNLN